MVSSGRVHGGTTSNRLLYASRGTACGGPNLPVAHVEQACGERTHARDDFDAIVRVGEEREDTHREDELDAFQKLRECVPQQEPVAPLGSR